MKTKPGDRYFTAERNQSYACKSKDDVTLQEYFKNNNTVNVADIEQVEVQIWNAHVQAFDIPPSGKFSQSKLPILAFMGGYTYGREAN